MFLNTSTCQEPSWVHCSYLKTREADIPQFILLPEGKCTLIVLKASSQVCSVHCLSYRCTAPISNFVFTELSLCLSGSLISSFLLQGYQPLCLGPTLNLDDLISISLTSAKTIIPKKTTFRDFNGHIFWGPHFNPLQVNSNFISQEMPPPPSLFLRNKGTQRRVRCPDPSKAQDSQYSSPCSQSQGPFSSHLVPPPPHMNLNFLLDLAQNIPITFSLLAKVHLKSDIQEMISFFYCHKELRRLCPFQRKGEGKVASPGRKEV